ncbi:hypothetical protein PG984_005747 [Apiospora sp. TS-2023a]
MLSWLKPLQQFAVAQLAVWARWLVLSQQQELKVGYIEIEEPDGNVITRGTKPPSPKPMQTHTNGNTAAAAATTKSLEGRLKIHSNTVWLRLLLFGSLGLAEAYMAGEVDSPDLTAFLVVVLLAENRAATAWTKRTAYDAFFRWSVVGPALLRKAHDVATARLNAVRHYSLSNAVFAAFLDESMTYSCPLWRDPKGGPSFAMTTTKTKAGEEIPEKQTAVNGHHDAEEKDEEADTLEEAQKRKLRFIVRAARIKPTDHVLEIGGGWGSFAILAARETGCHVTTITPSEEQASLIRDRVAAATSPALSPGQVQVLVCDYREKFDKIVSIEMLEHVGHECFETYFRCVDRYLTDAPGDIAVFQSITMSDAHYEAYLRGGDDFIRRYVFPGGELPSVAALVEGIRRGSGGRLVVEDVTSVGAHYARALRCWRQRFLGRFEGEIVPELQRRGRGEGEGGSGKMGKGGGMGMSKAEIEIFRRKWVYYFASCEAAFRTKSIGDVVITVGRDGCVEFLEDSL